MKEESKISNPSSGLASRKDFLKLGAAVVAILSGGSYMVNRMREGEFLTPEKDPKQYAAFKQTYDALIALVPPSAHASLEMPRVLLRDMSGYDAHYNAKDNIIDLAHQAYHMPEPLLKQTLGHELGHWLTDRNQAVAEEISGIRHPAVKPVLDELQNKIDAVIPDPKNRAKLMAEYRYQLVADGISARINCNRGAMTGLMKKGQEDDVLVMTQFLLGKSASTDFAKDAIVQDIAALLAKVRATTLSQFHPSDEMRGTFVERIVDTFCPSGPAR